MDSDRFPIHEWKRFLAKVDFFLSVVLPREKISPGTEACRLQLLNHINEIRCEELCAPYLPHVPLQVDGVCKDCATQYEPIGPVDTQHDGRKISTTEKTPVDTESTVLFQTQQQTTASAQETSVVSAKQKSKEITNIDEDNIQDLKEKEISKDSAVIEETARRPSSLSLLQSTIAALEFDNPQENTYSTVDKDKEEFIAELRRYCDAGDIESNTTECLKLTSSKLGPQKVGEKSTKVEESSVFSTKEHKDQVVPVAEEVIQPKTESVSTESAIDLPQFTKQNCIVTSPDEIFHLEKSWESHRSSGSRISSSDFSFDDSEFFDASCSGSFSSTHSSTWSEFSPKSSLELFDAYKRRSLALDCNFSKTFGNTRQPSNSFSGDIELEKKKDYTLSQAKRIKENNRKTIIPSSNELSFITIQLKDKTHLQKSSNKKKIRMNRKLSLSSNIWQALADQLSEDSAFFESPLASSDILKWDQRGWLVCQSEGRKYWCIVADILLCLFDSPESCKAEKVLVLPGYEVKPLIVHLSESQTTAVSGMGKYQFKMTHQNAKGAEFVFSVENEQELSHWIRVIRLASTLDCDFSSDMDDDDSSSSDDTGYLGNLSCYSNNNNDLELPAAKYQLPCLSPDITGGIANSTPGKTFFDLTNDEQKSDQKTFNTEKSRMIFDSSLTSVSSQPMSCNSLGHRTAMRNSVGSYDRSVSVEDSQCSLVDGLLDKGKHDRASTEPSRSLGMKLAQRALKVKDRVSSLRVNKQHRLASNDTTTVKSLSDIRISGELQRKTKNTWVNCWCVVSQRNLYVFKTHQPEELVESIVPLLGCKVSKSQKEKVPNMFKISHPHYKSLYLQAFKFSEMLQWIDVLTKATIPMRASYSDSKLKTTSTLKPTIPLSKSASFNMLHDKFGAGPIKKSNGVANGKITIESPVARKTNMETLKMSKASFLEGYENGKSNVDSHDLDDIIDELASIEDHDDVFVSSSACHSEDDSSQSDLEFSTPRPLRKKSIHGSLGDIPGTALQNNGKKNNKNVKSSKKKLRAKTVIQMPAADWTNPTKAGYLNRKNKGPWVRCWIVLNNDTLYTYKSPEDTHTLDTIMLPGYRITTDVRTAFKSRKQMFKLSHEGARSTYFSSECESEMMAWVSILRKATQKISVEGLNLEKGSSVHFEKTQAEEREALKEEKQQEFQQHLAQLQKQNLLEEVLHNKKELKQKDAKPKTPATKEEIQAKYQKSIEEEELKTLKYQTILNKRRMSAQLKTDDLTKRMTEAKKKKGVSETEYAAMERRLEELNETLKKVEGNITRNKNMKEKVVESLKDKKELELKIVAQQQRMKLHRKAAAEKALLTISETVGQISPKASEQIARRQLPDTTAASNGKRKARALPVIPVNLSPSVSIRSGLTDCGGDNSSEYYDKLSLSSSISTHSFVSERTTSSGETSHTLAPSDDRSLSSLERQSAFEDDHCSDRIEVPRVVVVSASDDGEDIHSNNGDLLNTECSKSPRITPVITEVSADTIAEIEAFEKLAMDMLKRDIY